MKGWPLTVSPRSEAKRHALERIPGKRAFDIGVSALALLMLSPALLLIAVAVRLTSGRPVLYRDVRVGLGGQHFHILKFRTMVTEQRSSVRQLTTAFRDPRITPLGRVLRKYKLDETPQLMNVLLGEMSIVGPRPEFPQWVELYDDRDLIALTVRPGLTDYASVHYAALDQVIGADDADSRYLRTVFKDKNALRLQYVETMCWRNDLRLIAATARVITQGPA